jgi:hypothetical protein
MDNQRFFWRNLNCAMGGVTFFSHDGGKGVFNSFHLFIGYMRVAQSGSYIIVPQ